MSHEVWQKLWGVEYRRDLREMQLRTLFSDLETNKLLGNVVLDVGSGAYPVSSLLDSSKYKIITIDLAGLSGTYDQRLHIKGNAETLIHPELFSTKKAFIQMAKFVEIDLKNLQNREQVDTIILSQILNYVDFQQVLVGAAGYLKPGGLFIIINKPNFGFVELFSPLGLGGNYELKKQIKSLNFKILAEIYPWNSETAPVCDDSMLILAAQKISTNTEQEALPEKTKPSWKKIFSLFR